AGGGGERARSPSFPSVARILPGPGQAFLATWHQLLDTGRMQDGEPFLAGTARPAEALMSAAIAAEAGIADGDRGTVTTAQGAITVGGRVHDMPDRGGWLAAHAPGCEVRRELGARNGTLVTLRSS